MCNWISNETFNYIWIACFVILGGMHFASGFVPAQTEQFFERVVNISIFGVMAIFMVVFAINGIVCAP